MIKTKQNKKSKLLQEFNLEQLKKEKEIWRELAEIQEYKFNYFKFIHMEAAMKAQSNFKDKPENQNEDVESPLSKETD